MVQSSIHAYMQAGPRTEQSHGEWLQDETPTCAEHHLVHQELQYHYKNKMRMAFATASSLQYFSLEDMIIINFFCTCQNCPLDSYEPQFIAVQFCLTYISINTGRRSATGCWPDI